MKNIENKVINIIIILIISLTLFLILFVHMSNTSIESMYPIENNMVCPYE